MANQFRVRKGLIVNGSGSTILDIQGSQGQLFSITDSLSGSLFSARDISGIPIIEAFSDNRVNIGTFNAEAIKVSGSFAFLTGSLRGTASNAVTASYVTGSIFTVGNLVLSSSFAVSSSFVDYNNVGNKPTLFSGSSQVQLNQISGTTFADTLYTFPGDVVVQGNVTAEQLIVSTSVYFVTTSFSSGSTIFGNSTDDRHQFTGSVSVSGSLVVQNLDLLSLSIFRQTGSIWATTNNLQITGSTSVNGNLVVNGIVSGNFYGPGDNISFNRIGTSQSAVSELVIGNWFNNYQFLQTTTFRNSNVIVSGNLSIQSGSVLQLGATTIPPTPVTGGIYYQLNDGFYVAEI